MAKEWRRPQTAQSISLVLKTRYLSSILLRIKFFIFSVTWELSNMAKSMAKESILMQTAHQSISLLVKTRFPPSASLTHLISSFSYEGAFENGEKHGQGTETFPDGSRYFSPSKDSIPTIHLSYAFNFFF